MSNPIEEKIERLFSIFQNRFYLEIQRIGKKDEDNLINYTLNCGEKYNIPVVPICK